MWSATKIDHRVGIRILAVVFDGGQLLVIRSAAEKILHAAHEENLKGRHQGRRAGAVENFRQIIFAEVELKETEVPQIGWDQVFQNRIAKALAEKSLIAHKYIGRAQLARFQLADKALGLGEGSHVRRQSLVLSHSSSGVYPRRWARQRLR